MFRFQPLTCTLIAVLSGCSTKLAEDSGVYDAEATTDRPGAESGDDTDAPDESDTPDSDTDSDGSDEDDTPPADPPDEDDSPPNDPPDEDDFDEDDPPDEDHSEEGDFDESDSEAGDSVSVSTDSVPTALPPSGTEGELVVETAVATGRVIADLNVTISLTHTCTKDLTAVLASPEGTTVELFDLTVRPVCSSDLSNTILDDDATVLLSSGSSPFVGPHRPSGSLADFNGEVGEGTWTLSIVDDTIGDRGSLTKWTLDFVFAD